MSENPNFAYDKVLYPNYLHAQTHPDRLATMTKFFGVKPKPVENCRVLELGCGTGSSLLSFACDLQGSEFVGVDLSEKQIELGKQTVSEIGLKNLDLRQADIMQINRENYGEFDYIIAHGVYSWVPDFVRDQMLKICGEMLAEQGVAFISYNALPGAHFSQMAREMMLFHTKNLTSIDDKVNESLGLLKFIADASPPDKVYHRVLQDELKKLSERNFANVYHDELADFYKPVYFYEFMDHAHRHNLQFVTEVERFTTKDLHYPKEVLETLREISDNVIALDQYLDFIKGRRFRQTLLCRKDLEIKRQPDPQILREIRIASPLKALSEKPDLAGKGREIFVGEENGKIEIDHPLIKTALFYLGKIWTRSAEFSEIIENCRKILSEQSGGEAEISEKDKKILTDVLFQAFCSGLLRFYVHEPRYATKVSEKPVASPIARWQVEHNQAVSTLLCTSVEIQDSLARELVRILDGTRDHERLVADLTEFINSEKFDESEEIKNTILQYLPEQLENNLKNFAGMALLVA